jgi:hypothetical protein
VRGGLSVLSPIGIRSPISAITTTGLGIATVAAPVYAGVPRKRIMRIGTARTMGYAVRLSVRRAKNTLRVTAAASARRGFRASISR